MGEICRVNKSGYKFKGALVIVSLSLTSACVYFVLLCTEFSSLLFCLASAAMSSSDSVPSDRCSAEC